MKAVNLIPAERAAAARQAVPAALPYAVLGVLALLVVMASAYTVTTSLDRGEALRGATLQRRPPRPRRGRRTSSPTPTSRSSPGAHLDG